MLSMVVEELCKLENFLYDVVIPRFILGGWGSGLALVYNCLRLLKVKLDAIQAKKEPLVQTKDWTRWKGVVDKPYIRIP